MLPSRVSVQGCLEPQTLLPPQVGLNQPSQTHLLLPDRRQAACMSDLACSSLSVLLSCGPPLRLNDLQSLTQSTRGLRALIQGQANEAWLRSAAATVPSWHPLLGRTDIPAGQPSHLLLPAPHKAEQLCAQLRTSSGAP